MLSEVGHFDHLEIFFLKYMFKPFACFIFEYLFDNFSLPSIYETIIRYLLYFYLWESQFLVGYWQEALVPQQVDLSLPPNLSQGEKKEGATMPLTT